MASSRDLPGLGCCSGVRLLIDAPDVCHKCLRMEIFSSEVLFSPPPHVILKLEVDGLKGEGGQGGCLRSWWLSGSHLPYRIKEKVV